MKDRGRRRPIVLHITTVPLSLRFLHGQVGYIKARGFDVRAVSSPGLLLEKFSQEEQISVNAVEMLRMISPVQDVGAIFKLWLTIRRVRPKIVHAHTPKGALLGMISAWLAGAPVRIYHAHGLASVTATGLKRRLLLWSEKVSCALAHEVLCVSGSLRDQMVSEGLCRESKARVLASGSINGVNAETEFCPEIAAERAGKLRAELGIPGEALVVGFVGRIVRDKGLVELTEAWKTLREEFPELRLLLVGPFEPQDPVPLEVEQALRSDSRVHLTGWVDDLPAYYAMMDVLAFPTHREGFGLVAIEANAIEKPVVASRIPGCVDAVQDGVTGALVPVRDPVALAEALRKYLKDPDLRRRHGQSGRERVLREFRQETIWQATYEEYLHLMERFGVPLPSNTSDHEELPQEIVL